MNSQLSAAGDKCVVQDFLNALSYFLREPRDITSRILASNRQFLDQIERRRNSTLTAAELERHRTSLHIHQQQEYAALSAVDDRSRILVSYHFGDFVYGLNDLMCLESPGRKRMVYSQEPGSDAYFDNIMRCFGAHAVGRECQLTPSDTTALALCRQLRRGNCTLVTFGDLPHGFGETVKVHFLNRPAWFPRGPAVLSLLSGTPMLPVINHFDGVANRVSIGKPIAPDRRLDECLQEAVARLTQQLTDFLGLFLQRFPEQWRYLQLLPGYFFDGAEADCPTPTTLTQPFMENTDDSGRSGSSHFQALRVHPTTPQPGSTGSGAASSGS